MNCTSIRLSRCTPPHPSYKSTFHSFIFFRQKICIRFQLTSVKIWQKWQCSNRKLPYSVTSKRLIVEYRRDWISSPLTSATVKYLSITMLSPAYANVPEINITLKCKQKESYYLQRNPSELYVLTLSHNYNPIFGKVAF